MTGPQGMTPLDGLTGAVARLTGAVERLERAAVAQAAATGDVDGHQAVLKRLDTTMARLTALIGE